MKTPLQRRREEKGLTRRQLGEKAGIGWETIKAYEVKGATPSLKIAFRLAGIFECKVEELFYVQVGPEEIVNTDVQ